MNPYKSPSQSSEPRKRGTIAGIIRSVMFYWAVIVAGAFAIAAALGFQGIGQWEFLLVLFLLGLVFFIGIYRVLGLFA